MPKIKADLSALPILDIDQLVEYSDILDKIS
jgi:hypothetical protein